MFISQIKHYRIVNYQECIFFEKKIQIVCHYCTLPGSPMSLQLYKTINLNNYISSDCLLNVQIIIQFI